MAPLKNNGYGYFFGQLVEKIGLLFISASGHTGARFGHQLWPRCRKIVSVFVIFSKQLKTFLKLKFSIIISWRRLCDQNELLPRYGKILFCLHLTIKRSSLWLIQTCAIRCVKRTRIEIFLIRYILCAIPKRASPLRFIRLV